MNNKYHDLSQVNINSFMEARPELPQTVFGCLQTMIREAIKTRSNLLLCGDSFRGVGKTCLLLDFKRGDNLLTLTRRQSELKEPYTPLQLVLTEYNNKNSYKPIILVDDIDERHALRLINQGNIVIGFVKRECYDYVI